jgi:inorganic pyrophosphatase
MEWYRKLGKVHIHILMSEFLLFSKRIVDPKEVSLDTGKAGDGDPLDVVEALSDGSIGQVLCVKIIGIWGMIDQGETDWKILAGTTICVFDYC